MSIPSRPSERNVDAAATTEARIEELEDAIRDMLDFTVGYCRPMTDAEKLDAIRVAGEKVLAA